MNRFAEKAELIEQILDRIKPIPENAPGNVKEAINSDRQILVMRAGFSQMSIEELKAKLA